MLAANEPRAAVLAKLRADGVEEERVLGLDPNQPTISPPPPPPVKRTGGGYAIPPPQAPLTLSQRYARKLNTAPPVALRSLFWQRIATDELDGTWALGKSH